MKMRTLFFSSVLSLCVLSPLVQAANAKPDSAEEKRKEEEERLRETARKLITDSGNRQAYTGKFTASHDDGLAQKPLPKIIGTFITSSGALPTMVADQGIMKLLCNMEHKDIIVMGALLERTNQDPILVVDEVSMPPAPPMDKHRKRGGI